MLNSVKRLPLAAILAALVGVHTISGANAAPHARAAKAANAMIATVTNTTTPDSGRNVYLTIAGKIQAAVPKYAPRRCRVDRVIEISSPSIGGALVDYGASYPTNKKGRFGVEFALQYGGTDEDGVFYDGSVPFSGGTATFTLTTGRSRVPRDPSGFRSYTCRPLSLTIQFLAPPAPGF